MASGIKYNGTDLDDIFATRATMLPTANVNIKSGGTDLSDRYYPSQGADKIDYNVNIKSNGTDLSQIFRKKAYSTPTPTPTPTSTPTPTPSSTPTPTPTPTATPNPTPSPTYG